MSDELRFKRRSNIAGAVCYVLLLAVSLAIFGSIASIDYFGLVNDLFGLIAKGVQELLGNFWIPS